jgi:glycogen phosphorylase
MNIQTLPPVPFQLPEALENLQTLAMNARWSWRRPVQNLFRELDPELWSQRATPVRILRETRNLPAFASNPSFTKRVNEAAQELQTYLAESPKSEPLVAYFCAEFGLHSSLFLYSGGLGILAGDHCKEASDLNLPFVAIGLFYRRGFFRQLVDQTGRQEHEYPLIPAEWMPLERVAVDGKPLTIGVEFPGRTVHAAVWRMKVGRITLLLLDTDLPENAPEDRPITSQLYTSGRDMRLHQEIILGVGGTRALFALGIQPGVYHLNEGHSALLLLERIQTKARAGTSFNEACKAVRESSILTIHTPVPAGNERFDMKHARALIEPILAGSGVTANQITKLAVDSEGDKTTFDMTGLAVRLTRAANGVSLLHGRTADSTWGTIARKPLIGVTNGVHVPTWLGPHMRALFETHGASFEPVTDLALAARKGQRAEWSGAEKISGQELLEAHRLQKEALVEFARSRMFSQLARHGVGPSGLREWVDLLDPDAFLIGFARRFATYKRANLILRDLKRFRKLVNQPGRKVQVLFAGKAHPADGAGQALIQQVYRATQQPEFRGSVFFLEEYDIEAGGKLVQGADIWLNNPIRPLEASGTSGMKAAANGVPNVSILDGWWDEACEHGVNGWAIGDRTAKKSSQAQDAADAKALYGVLEHDVLATYADKKAWAQVMRRSIATSVHAFSTRRMLEDYLDQMVR